MAMKPVANIRIGTESMTYMITYPNITHIQVEKMIEAAMKLAEEEVYDASYVFEFENERLVISEEPLYIHYYIKQDNYAFDTPDVRIHNR